MEIKQRKADLCAWIQPCLKACAPGLLGHFVLTLEEQCRPLVPPAKWPVQACDSDPGLWSTSGPLVTMSLTSSLERQHPQRCDRLYLPFLTSSSQWPLVPHPPAELRSWASWHREARAVRTRGFVSSRVANRSMSQS